MLVNDTIAAIATGMGNAGVGIIRISGKNAVEVASKVFRQGKCSFFCAVSVTIHWSPFSFFRMMG